MATTKTVKKTTKRLSKKKKGEGGKRERALESLMTRLEAIPEDELTRPAIPVDRLVAEAHVLVRVAKKHLPALEKVGFGKKDIKDISTAANALQEAQTRYLVGRSKVRSDDEVALEQEGIRLRSDMVADGRFALRANAQAARAIDLIQEGEGLDDLVQDLLDLAAFFEEHKAALDKVGAHALSKSQHALSLAEHLQGHVTDRRSEDDDTPKLVRDRAVAHLVSAMREVRAAGTYALRGKPSAQARFRSAYEAARIRRKKAGGEDKAPEPSKEDSSPSQGGAPAA